MSALNEAEIRLAHVLGLRKRELVTSGPHLAQSEEQLRAGQPVVTLAGTKSSKPLRLYVEPQGRAAALEAMDALRLASQSQDGLVVALKAQKPLFPPKGPKGIRGPRQEFAEQQLAHQKAKALSREAAAAKVAAEMGGFLEKFFARVRK